MILKMKQKTQLFVGVFLLVLIVGCTTTETIQQEDTIKIGWIGALSGSATDWGVPALKAAKLALEDANKEGKKLEFIVEDGAGDAKTAANAAHKLIYQDNVDIILSHSSAESLAIAPLAEENNVIMFASATSTPDLTHAGDYIFRVTPVNREGETLADALHERDLDNIAVIVEQGKYTQGIKNGFLNTYTGNIVALEEYNSDTQDFRTALTKIKAEEPEALLVLPVGLNAGTNIITQAKELGFTVPIFGNAAYDSPELVNKLGNQAEGIMFSTLFIDKNRPDVKDFARRYGEEIPVFAHTLDAASKVYIIDEALEVCGEDNDCIKNFLYSIEDKDTLSGILTLDENGDAEKGFILKEISDRKAVVVN